MTCKNETGLNSEKIVDRSHQTTAPILDELRDGMVQSLHADESFRSNMSSIFQRRITLNAVAVISWMSTQSGVGLQEPTLPLRRSFRQNLNSSRVFGFYESDHNINAEGLLKRSYDKQGYDRDIHNPAAVEHTLKRLTD